MKICIYSGPRITRSGRWRCSWHYDWWGYSRLLLRHSQVVIMVIDNAKLILTSQICQDWSLAGFTANRGGGTTYVYCWPCWCERTILFICFHLNTTIQHPKGCSKSFFLQVLFVQYVSTISRFLRPALFWPQALNLVSVLSSPIEMVQNGMR